MKSTLNIYIEGIRDEAEDCETDLTLSVETAKDLYMELSQVLETPVENQ